MRLSQGRLEQLMAYADGELASYERLEVEALLSENEDARQFLRELGHLGGLVREGWQETAEAKAVASFDIAGDVMKAIAAEEPKREVAAPAPVRSLDAERARRAGRLRTGGFVVAVFAAAAAIAVFTRSPAETPVAKAPVAAPAAPQGGGSTSGQSTGPGVEVEALESPGSSVSVFHLPGASELSTSVVVWVEEDKKP